MSKLHPGTLRFLASLAKNNNKDWFTANKTDYQAIRSEFAEFANSLAIEIAKFDNYINDAIADQQTVKIFRINRDVRFSKDKSPYKTNLGADISVKRADAHFPSYYIHIKPGDCFVGGGIYQPQPKVLGKIRDYVEQNYSQLKMILDSKTFNETFGSLMGEKLKTNPRGYAQDSPAIEFLRHKSFAVSASVPDSQVLSSDFVARSMEIFSLARPLNEFLYKAVKN